MSTITPSLPNPAARARQVRTRLNAIDRRRNRLLKWLCVAGGAVICVAMAGIAFEVINGASPAIEKYGAGFLVHKEWVPNAIPPRLGALAFIYGTLVTSVFSLILATLLGLAIGLYLSMLAPKAVSAVVGPMVEMLAAVPSVVIGFIGIILIVPFVHSTLEPAVHAVLGWIPLFGSVPATGYSIFTASLVLTIMVLPIISALSRDLFRTVPRELTEGAEALGSTRWEVVRGIVLPTTSSGIIATCVLGFGRAIGEAIAVSYVIGSNTQAPLDLFGTGNSGAALIATQFASPDNALHLSGMYYLATILFAFSVITNLAARQIASGFSVMHGLGYGRG